MVKKNPAPKTAAKKEKKELEIKTITSQKTEMPANKKYLEKNHYIASKNTNALSNKKHLEIEDIIYQKTNLPSSNKPSELKPTPPPKKNLLADKQEKKSHNISVSPRTVAYQQVYLKNRQKYTFPFTEYDLSYKDSNHKNISPQNLDLIPKREYSTKHEEAQQKNAELEDQKNILRKEKFYNTIRESVEGTPLSKEEYKKKRKRDILKSLAIFLIGLTPAYSLLYNLACKKINLGNKNGQTILYEFLIFFWLYLIFYFYSKDIEKNIKKKRKFLIIAALIILLITYFILSISPHLFSSYSMPCGYYDQSLLFGLR